MDCMSDALFNAHRFRVLMGVDCHSREALAVIPRESFPAFGVVEVLDRSPADGPKLFLIASR